MKTGQSDEFWMYAFERVSENLAIAGQHERLWRLLQDESFREKQICELGNYDAALRFLRAGVTVYAKRNGQAVDDDARLCWLAIRAGELSWQAKCDTRLAFKCVRESPLADPGRIPHALARLETLNILEFYLSVSVLLWIEAQRQNAREDSAPDPAGALLLMAEVARRMQRERDTVDWEEALRFPGFMAPLVLKLMRFAPRDPVATFLGVVRGDNRKALVEAICAQQHQEPAEHRAEAVHLAFSLVAGMDDGYQRDEAAKAVSEAAVRGRGLTEHAAIVDQTENEGLGSSFLSHAAYVLAMNGLAKDASDVARQISDPELRTRCLSDVADELVKMGQTAGARNAILEALGSTPAIGSANNRARWIVNLAGWLKANNDAKRCSEALEDALAITDQIDDSNGRILRMCGIAHLLGMLGEEGRQKELLCRAIAVAERIAEVDERADSLLDVAESLTSAGWIAWGMRVVGVSVSAALQAADKKDAGWCLSRAANMYVEHGRFREGLAACLKVEDEDYLKDTLAEMRGKFIGEDAIEHFESFLDALGLAIERIESEECRSELRSELVAALAEKGRIHEARLVATKAGPDQIGAISTLSQILAKKGQCSTALSLASDTIRAFPKLVVEDDERWFCYAMLLVEIAGACLDESDGNDVDRILTDAFAVARQIKNPVHKFRALEAIALFYGQAGLFEEACQVAQCVGVDTALPAGAGGLVQSEAIEHYRMTTSSLLGNLVKLAIEQTQTDAALSLCHYIPDKNVRASSLEVLAVALAKDGQVDEALSVTHRIENKSSKRRAIQCIASQWAEDDNASMSLELTERYLVAHHPIDFGDVAELTLSGIATEFGKRGQVSCALDVIGRIQDRGHRDAEYRNSLVSDLVDTLAETGFTSEALSLASEIEADGERNHRLRRIAGQLAQRGLHQQVGFIIQRITNDDIVARAQSEAALALAKAGQADPAIVIAENINKKRHDGFYHIREHTLKELVRVLLEAGDLENARRILSKIKRPWYLAWSIQSFGKECARTKMIDRARKEMDVALAIAGESRDLKERMLVDFLEVLLEAVQQKRGIVEQLSRIAENAEGCDRAGYSAHVERCRLAADPAHTLVYIARLDDDEDRAWALTKLATALFSSGRGEESDEIFARAASVSESIQDCGGRVRALSRLAVALARTGQLDRAIATSDAVSEPGLRSATNASMAEALAEVGDTASAHQLYREAESLIENPKDDWEREQLIERFVAHLRRLIEWRDESSVRELLNQATLVIGVLSDDEKAYSACLKLSEILASGEFYSEAMDVVQEYVQPHARALLRNHLTQQLVKSRCFTQALEMLLRPKDSAGVAGDIQVIARGIYSCRDIGLEDLRAFQPNPLDLGITPEEWRNIRPYWHAGAAKAGPAALSLLRERMVEDIDDPALALSAVMSLFLSLLIQSEEQSARKVLQQCPRMGLGFLLDEQRLFSVGTSHGS